MKITIDLMGSKTEKKQEQSTNEVDQLLKQMMGQFQAPNQQQQTVYGGYQQQP
jgi:hypothetical protein